MNDAMSSCGWDARLIFNRRAFFDKKSPHPKIGLNRSSMEPQGMKSKIVVPDSCVEDNGNAEFIAPTTSVAPEEIVLGNIDLDIYDETVVSESNDNNELTVHEEEEVDPDFHCDEDLEDVSVAESIDDFDFSS